MSDASLRALQKLASVNDDLESWKRYALHLERTISVPGHEVPPSPTHQLEVALAEYGFKNIHEISTITSMPELARLVAFLFPFGKIVDFLSNELSDPDIKPHDAVVIKTGIYAYRAIPDGLEEFFAGEGFLDHIQKGAEVKWFAPFGSAGWTPPAPEVAPEERYRENRAARQASWNQQKLIYLPNKPQT